MRSFAEDLRDERRRRLVEAIFAAWELPDCFIPTGIWLR